MYGRGKGLGEAPLVPHLLLRAHPPHVDLNLATSWDIHWTLEEGEGRGEGRRGGEEGRGGEERRERGGGGEGWRGGERGGGGGGGEGWKERRERGEDTFSNYNKICLLVTAML